VIARIWRGWTTPENADTYQRIVSQEVLPGIAARNLDGYHGAYLLRRRLDDEVEFATILLLGWMGKAREQRPGAANDAGVRAHRLGTSAADLPQGRLRGARAGGAGRCDHRR
jgi:hypothetical protein